MINCKGQIGLAAAEIDDFKRFVALVRKVREHVFHDFQVAVNLTELAVMLWNDFAGLVHYAETNEEVARHSVGNYILFGSVMFL